MMRGLALTPFRFFCLLLLVALPLRAQITTGDVLGTVTDATGSVIPNAQISLVSKDTGAVRNSTSGPGGEFLFSLIQSGQYSLRVKANGFTTFVIDNITVSAGERVRETPVMKPGAETETVDVSGTAATLQTDTSSISTSVTNKQAEDLPLNGRNFVQLAQLAPGANEGTAASMGGGNRPDDRRQTSSVSANAQSDTLNNELVDGVDNNEGTIGTIGVRPSVEAIAEFRVLTSNYPAEAGKTAGAIVNIITKSGSNKFHGSAYEFLRNDALDGRNFFATTGRRPEFRQNQFGGSFEGPIFKDKTFFFGDYEGYRSINAGTTYVNTVPTAYEQQHPGDLSDVGGPVIANPNAVALKYFALYPLPNVGANTFTYSPRGTQNSNLYDVRLDHRWSDKDQTFARYAYNQVVTFVPGTMPTVNGIDPGGSVASPGTSFQRAQQFLLNHTHVFSPRTVVELKAGYTHLFNNTAPLNYGKALGNQFGIANSNYNAFTSFLPFVTITGYAGFGGTSTLPLFDGTNTFQYSASITHTIGNHTLKAGAVYIRRQIFNQQNASAGAGSFGFTGAYSKPLYTSAPATLDPLIDFFLGKPYSVLRGVQLYGRYLRTFEPSVYAQDDWRVNSKLTLNLGLRWDMWTPVKEIQGHISQFDITTGAIIVANTPGVSDTTNIHTDYGSIAPRFGFALNVRPGTVVRGGFGMAYFRDSTGPSVPFADPPYTATYSPSALSTNFGDPLPLPTAQSTTNLTGALRGIDPNFKNSYAEQYNLNVQQEVHGTVLSAAYVGSVTKHVRIAPDINLAAPQLNPAGTNTYKARRPFATLYPNLDASINILQSGGFGNYNSLQVSALHSYSHGLTAQVNYTWAHALNDTQAFAQGGLYASVDTAHFNTLEYSNSDLDVRHRVTMLINYKLPFGGTLHGVPAIFLKGWQANAIDVWMTGQPLTVLNSSPRSNTGAGSDRPNQTGDASLPNPTIAKFFDTSKFTPQAFGSIGTARRTSVYGPHFRHFDFSIFKDFALPKHSVLQFRAESFNLTNTPNFAQPLSTVGTTTFGSITSTRFGSTPRQIQFALRLSF